MSLIWDIIGDALRISALAALGTAGILAVLIWKQNLRNLVSYIRFIVQAVAFGVIFYISSKPIPLLYYLLVLFPMTLVLGRLYCGWFCPFGFIMDITIQLKRSFRKSYRILSDRLNKSLHRLRYAILISIFLLPIILWRLDPPPNLDFAVLMFQFFSGPFRPYSILNEPMTTLVVPWVSPFTFNSISFNYPYAQNIVTIIGGNVGQVITIIFVVLTLTGSFFIKRPWCRFCPTGSSIAAINRFKGFKWSPMLYIDKDGEHCNDCGVCNRACPVQVKELCEQKTGKINSTMCILCTRCVESCPNPDALRLKLGNKTLFRSRNLAGKIPNWLRKAIIRS
jgi:ferredoxin-type protein NapH